MIDIGTAFAQPEGNVSQAAARRGFKGYGPGERKRVGKRCGKGNPVLRQLRDIFISGDLDEISRYAAAGFVNYDIAEKAVRSRNLKYSSQDIEDFSIVIGEFQYECDFDRKAGHLLSALINNCEDKEFTLILKHEIQLDSVGFRNRKKIHIIGDGGRALGHCMEDGSIIVEGNAGHCIGIHMTGGRIEVKGNVGESTGVMMSGGRIIVRGNAGKDTGSNANGGEIHIEGEYERVSRYVGRINIYHKRELIHGKGKTT